MTLFSHPARSFMVLCTAVLFVFGSLCQPASSPLIFIFILRCWVAIWVAKVSTIHFGSSADSPTQ